jgi:hypothetical protein
MPEDTLSPLENVSSLSPDTYQTPVQLKGSVYRAVGSDEDSDMSFMSFFDVAMEAEAVNGQAAVNPAETPHVSEPVKAQDNAKPAEKTDEKSDTDPVGADNKTSSSSDVSHSSDTSKKDLRDATDLWVMDGKQLGPNDFRILQNLAQVAPVPMQMFNNLSPSLIDQLPKDYYKSMNVSQGLQDMLDNAYKTQKPIRIDLSDDASIILRMGRDGRVSAEFLPNSQATEMYFRQNMLELKNRLESKQLPYGELTVRQWKDDNPQSDNQNGEYPS